MYRVITKFTITQQANPARSGTLATFVIPFCNEFEVKSSWNQLTDTATITLPKNMVLKDTTGKQLINLNASIGGFSAGNPFFLKGDTVTIEAGYKYPDKTGKEITDTAVVFTGYISRVTSKKPFVLECEDNMWKLKQIPALDRQWKASEGWTLQKIISECLKGTPFTVSKAAGVTLNFNVGDFVTNKNESVAQVLERIRKDYHIESYFRGTELRIGFPIYYEAEAKTVSLTFQKNIISDDLEYKRKDDLQLSAVAYSVGRVVQGKKTKDGQSKTKNTRLEVLVSWSPFSNSFTVKQKPQGENASFAPGTSGERRTFYFYNVSDATTLGNLAIEQLKKYFYTGFSGKVTTFGIPFIKHGDNVQFTDSILPERNGTYKIKMVEWKGGVQGLRQTITLDFKTA